jgi:hypothetical protein
VDYNDLLNDGSTHEGREGLHEMVARGHEGAGWGFDWHHHLENLGIADAITVSFIETSNKFGSKSHRMMASYKWTANFCDHETRRGSFCIAKWPLGLADSIDDDMRQAIIDAGYGLAYSLQSYEHERIAKMRAEFAARHPDQGGNGNA